MASREACSLVRLRISSVISGVFRPDVDGDKTCGEFGSNPRRIAVRSLIGVIIIGVLTEAFLKLSRSLDPIPARVRCLNYDTCNSITVI